MERKDSSSPPERMTINNDKHEQWDVTLITLYEGHIFLYAATAVAGRIDWGDIFITCIFCDMNLMLPPAVQNFFQGRYKHICIL